MFNTISKGGERGMERRSEFFLLWGFFICLCIYVCSYILREREGRAEREWFEGLC